MPRHSQGSIQKEGSALVYLQEELTDARMRCDQLKRYIAEAVKLVNKSDKRDHFYEVAGNLLSGIPTALFKLDKALDATALAASRMDYEELKGNLKPEKVTELEEILDDVRIRKVDHRSTPTQDKTAMRTFKAASQTRISSALRRIADEVDAATLRPQDVTYRLRRVLMACATTADQAVQATWPQMADSREEVMDGFKKTNPDLSDADLNEIADQWEKNKNVVKDKSADSEEVKESKFEEGKPADPTENMSPEDSKKWKVEHDKHKDEFKSASTAFSWKVNAADADPSSVDKWFVQKGSTDMYFFCTEVQKNGRMKGPQVSFQGGKSKPTVATLSVMNPQMWKQVAAKDVPEEYREAVKDKGHSKA